MERARDIVSIEHVRAAIRRVASDLQACHWKTGYLFAACFSKARRLSFTQRITSFRLN